MRDDERDSGHATRDEPAAPAEPAKVHGDPLDDLIPRDLREPAPRIEPDDDESRERRERSPGER